MFTVILVVVAFVGGVLVGANNPKTVDKLIADIKARELQAKTTLNKILDHKAN